MKEKWYSAKFVAFSLVAVFFATFLWSVSISRFILIIPFNTYEDTTNVVRDFWITFAVSLGVSHLVILFFILLYCMDFLFESTLFRKFNLYIASGLTIIFNAIPFMMIFDVVNIVLCASKLFGSSAFRTDLFNKGKFISFVTFNYVGTYYRLIPIFCILFGMAAVSIYGLIEGHLLHVKNTTIKSDKFDRPFKFVHISDIHIGSRFLSHAEKIVKLILKEKPQFVVITGDLTDSPNVQEYELLPFKKLSEKCPIYMCMGNHDYVTGKTKVEEITRACKIHLLINEVCMVDKYNTMIAGTNDTNTLSHYFDSLNVVKQLVEPRAYNIMLQHRPQGVEETCETGLFDLMLSGHTHVGQFAPFGWFVYLFFRRPNGFYNIKKGDHKMKLYTSPGTGAWAPHMRTMGTNDIMVFHMQPTITPSVISDVEIAM